MPKKPIEPYRRIAEEPNPQTPATWTAAPSEYEAAFDDPAGRSRNFRRSRLGPDRRSLRDVILKASRAKRSAARRMLAMFDRPTPPGGPGTVNWAGLGPTKVDGGQAGAVHAVVSGRITSIAVGPAGTRAYVGSANGGTWVTEDGGTTWVALDEFANTQAGASGIIASALEADSLAVGAVAVKFGAARANDLIFVGTGEPGGNLDGYFGIGIKSSSDGGNTFSLEATNLASNEVYRVVIDPDDSTIVFAATTTGLFQRPTAAPFTTWNQVTSGFNNATGPCTDVLVAGKGAGKTYFAAFQGDTVYKSAPGSGAWTAVPGFGGAGRIALAAGENDASVVYALVADETLNRLDSGTGGSFQQVSGVPKALFAGKQGWYDAIVAVDPSNANTVYLAGDLTLDTDWALSLYKGTISGGPGAYVFPFNAANDQTDPNNPKTTSNVPSDPTWIGRGVHPDGHALAFATNADGTHDGSIVWVGCDGGIFVSTSGGGMGTFSPKNQGISITQMTYIGLRPDTPDILYGGCQDNGTIRFSLSGTPAWLEVVEGDGGGVAINPNNPQQIIRQYTHSNLSVSADDGATWASAGLPVVPQSAEDLRSGFYGPVKALAAGAQTAVAFGTNRLWFRSDWSAAWQSLPGNSTNDVLDDPDPTGVNKLPIVPVTAIAIASGTRVYAATSQIPGAPNAPGQAWHFEFAGGAWTKQALPAIPNTAPSVHFFTALSVEDPNAGTLYTTLGSGGGEHVFYFDGNAWVNATFSATNVDVPTHAVAVDPGNPTDVYVGTDVGVWKGTRSGTSWTWIPFSQGLPEAAITDLTIHASSRKLRAATHGRGVWEISLQPLAGPTVTGVAPTTGAAAGGDSVTVSGTGFTGATAVNFGSNAATAITVNSDTEITCTSPAGDGTVDVTVDGPGGTSAAGAADQFTYTVGAPAVTSIAPTTGAAAGGDSVTVSGTGFTGATAVNFGSNAATAITVNSDTEITCTSPAGDGTVDVTVDGPGGTSAAGAADQFTYTVGAPAVTSIAPTTGAAAGGDSVTVSGTGFTGATAVNFGSNAATAITVNSDTQITCTSPAGDGTVDVTVDGPGGTSATGAADQFTYTVAAPAVTSIDPTTGAAAGGDSVTVSGTGFTGATAVNFGSNAATAITVNSDTQIACTSPAGDGTVDVTVDGPGGTSATGAADQFTYKVAAPAVTSIDPTTGAAAGGDSVTVSGTGFTGATAVNFGSNAATAITVNSDNEIACTSPAGDGTVDVTVDGPGGTSAAGAADQFTYTVAAPAVTSIAPTTGAAAGGDSVTVSGTGFTGATAVNFGSNAATAITVNSDTEITCTSPAGDGTVDVTVDGPGGTSAAGAADQFTYV